MYRRANYNTAAQELGSDVSTAANGEKAVLVSSCLTVALLSAQ